MPITLSLSHLNSVAAGKVLALPGQVVSVVNIRSSNYNQRRHNNNNNCYFQFSSRLSTSQFRPITISPSSMQFCCRSWYTYNCCASLEKEEEEDYDYDYNNNNHENNIANTSPLTHDRMGGSSSSSSSLSSSRSTRSCSCNCQNTGPSIQINIVFPQLSASPTIAMLAHVYSKLHPLLDQLMLFVQDKSLFFFHVAVSDEERALRRKLNKIAENADTSTLNGLNYVLKEVVKALLQCNNSSIHYTELNTNYGFLKSLSKNYEKFLNRELESHGRDENIFINVDDNVEYKNKGSMVKANSTIENEYTVVTLVVLATGQHFIPDFKGKGARYHESLEVLQTMGDLGRCYDSFEVLRTLERISKNETQSVEVLWSPRKEDKVLLEDELLRDFRRLKRINNGLIYVQVKA